MLAPMKAVRWIAIVLGVYVGIVVLFESLIGILQPGDASTLVLITKDADGSSHDRVLSRIEIEDRLYVAANHWPRAWYDRALENSEVQVTLGEQTGGYTAVRVTEAERDRIETEHGLPFAIRFLTGFPPRVFVRLQPL